MGDKRNRKVYVNEALHFMAQLDSGSVGAVITDPPFFVSVGRSGAQGMGRDPWHAVSAMDEVVAWTDPHAAAVARVLRPGGALVVMGSSQSLSAWDLCTSRHGLSWMAELVVLWNTGEPRSRNFGGLFTTVRWYSRNGARHTFNSGSHRSIYSNVIVCDKVPLSDREHIAQKPVELTNFLISLLTEADDLIIDPFCGSGSTLVSAELCGRPWLGSDNDAAMAGVALRRGLHAEYESTNPLYLWVNGKTVEV